MIINPFSIDFNARKIQNKLYSELLEAEASYIEEKAHIQTLVIDYLDKLIHKAPYASSVSIDSFESPVDFNDSQTF